MSGSSDKKCIFCTKRKSDLKEKDATIKKLKNELAYAHDALVDMDRNIEWFKCWRCGHGFHCESLESEYCETNQLSEMPWGCCDVMICNEIYCEPTSEDKKIDPFHTCSICKNKDERWCKDCMEQCLNCGNLVCDKCDYLDHI